MEKEYRYDFFLSTNLYKCLGTFKRLLEENHEHENNQTGIQSSRQFLRGICSHIFIYVEGKKETEEQNQTNLQLFPKTWHSTPVSPCLSTKSAAMDYSNEVLKTFQDSYRISWHQIDLFSIVRLSADCSNGRYELATETPPWAEIVSFIYDNGGLRFIKA